MTAPARPVVVVGVDGSTGSRDAVRWAAGYARLAGAELRVVASWRWPNYVTRIPPGIDLEADTRRTLQEVAAEIGAEFPGVPIGEHVGEGPAGPPCCPRPPTPACWWSAPGGGQPSPACSSARWPSTASATAPVPW